MTSQAGAILWLASYPKSGSTWFRAFYTNLVQDGEAPASIDALLPPHMASNRSLFDDYAGLESSDLRPEEVEGLRPRVYETISRVEGKDGAQVLIKIHDALTLTGDGCPLVTRAATKGVIYFLRNPLDVAVSFAHHSATGIDTIIRIMADESYCFSAKRDRLDRQVRQRLLSWSSHVASWVDGMEDCLLVIRYEDMALATEDTFSRAVRFAGLPDDPDRIRKALRFSAFDLLREQERTDGFKEKPLKAESFFRKGKIGSWRGVLSDRQAERIIRDHGTVMKRFGYLRANDEPVF